jgi:hypothetical protein
MCLFAVNAAYTLDGQYELAFSMVTATPFGRGYRCLGMCSRGNHNLAIDLHWVDNFERNLLAHFGVRGTHRFGQPQSNVKGGIRCRGLRTRSLGRREKTDGKKAGYGRSPSPWSLVQPYISAIEP